MQRDPGNRKYNVKLRKRRNALMWSQRKAARAISRHCQEPVTLHVDTYAGWERGEHTPSLIFVPGLLGAFKVDRLEDLGYVLDGERGRLLTTDDAVTSQANRAAGGPRSGSSSLQDGSGSTGHGGVYGGSEIGGLAAEGVTVHDAQGEATDRKQFLRLGARTAGVLAAGGPVILRLLQQAERSNVGPDTLAELDAAVQRFALGYEQIPPAALVPQMHQHLGFVADLLDGWQSLADRTHLYVLGSKLSLLLGHSAFDLGDLHAAELHFSATLRLARELDHRDLAVWALGGQSGAALTTGRPQQALDLARAAVRLNGEQGSSARVKAMARQAMALAQLGDQTGVDAVLDRARTLARPPGEERIAGALAFDSFALERYAAGCQLTLDQPGRAAASLTRALSLYPSTPAENQSPINHTGAHILHATVLARQAEPEQACSVAARVLDLDRGQIVVPIRRSLDRLAAALRPYATLPHVQTFNERLNQHISHILRAPVRRGRRWRRHGGGRW